MILSAIILGATLIAGATIVATFWNEITTWLRNTITKVKQMIDGVVYGAKVFVKKISEGIQEISKHYSKNGQKWTETISTREVSESEVPEDIRRKAYLNTETDITSEYEMVLNS